MKPAGSRRANVGKWTQSAALRTSMWVSGRLGEERERYYLHVEDFIRALRLSCDVADFIGGLRGQRGRGVAVHRRVAARTAGERKERDRWP